MHNLYSSFTKARDAAISRSAKNECVSHVNAVLEDVKSLSGDVISHRVAGYYISDWRDASTVFSSTD